jgi:hypothetical protein
MYINELIIGANKIGDKGLQYLSKTYWPNLVILDLGIFIIYLIELNSLGVAGA